MRSRCYCLVGSYIVSAGCRARHAFAMVLRHAETRGVARKCHVGGSVEVRSRERVGDVFTPVNSSRRHRRQVYTYEMFFQYRCCTFASPSRASLVFCFCCCLVLRRYARSIYVRRHPKPAGSDAAIGFIRRRRSPAPAHSLRYFAAVSR